MARIFQSLTACALLAIFAFTASTAEGDVIGPFGGADTEPVEYDVRDLLKQYAEESGRSVLYRPAAVRHQITARAPEGSDHTAETVLRHALAQFRLVLVSEGDFDTVIPEVEASRRATYLPLGSEELANVHPLAYVSLLVPIRHADPTSLNQLIAERRMSALGIALAIDTQALVVSDYAYRIPRLLQVIAELDKPESFHAATIQLKHGDATEITDALNATFEVEGLNAVPVSSADSIALSDPPEVVRRAVALANELDAAAAAAPNAE
jgi:type II secretory pathway component GspD/PulD (secretin)